MVEAATANPAAEVLAEAENSERSSYENNTQTSVHTVADIGPAAVALCLCTEGTDGGSCTAARHERPYVMRRVYIVLMYYLLQLLLPYYYSLITTLSVSKNSHLIL